MSAQAQKQQSTGAGATGAPENKLGKTEQTAIIEDDDFEEFPSEEWDETGEDTTDKQLWEDNWDDDDVEDDFSCQLRAELERLGHKATQFPPVKQ